MKFFSLQTLFRTLSLSLLVVVGLSVLGCDSGGSNGGGPDWRGNWKQVDDSGNAEFAVSLSETEVKTTEQAGCNTRTWEIANVDVQHKAGDPGSNAEAELTAEDGTVWDVSAYPGGETLEVRFQDSDSNRYYEAADDEKTTEEIVAGCP